jgi:hypothetical protein
VKNTLLKLMLYEPNTVVFKSTACSTELEYIACNIAAVTYCITMKGMAQAFVSPTMGAESLIK